MAAAASAAAAVAATAALIIALQNARYRQNLLCSIMPSSGMLLIIANGSPRLAASSCLFKRCLRWFFLLFIHQIQHEINFFANAAHITNGSFSSCSLSSVSSTACAFCHNSGNDSTLSVLGVVSFASFSSAFLPQAPSVAVFGLPSALSSAPRVGKSISPSLKAAAL